MAGGPTIKLKMWEESLWWQRVFDQKQGEGGGRRGRRDRPLRRGRKGRKFPHLNKVAANKVGIGKAKNSGREGEGKKNADLRNRERSQVNEM